MHLSRGIKFMVLGERNSARAEIKVALKANPEHAEAWLTLGEVEFLDHDAAAMEPALNKAVFYMRDMDTYKKSAHMYFFSNDYQKALPLYSSLLTAYSQHLTSMARLAQIYEVAGDHASARELAKRLLLTVPRVPSDSDLRNVQVACSLLFDDKDNSCPRGAL
jgi:tetratricopeptide (TPR) repeat protein